MRFSAYSMSEQKDYVREQYAENNLRMIQKNLDAPAHPCQFDESKYDQGHYQFKPYLWRAPHPHVVQAFFDHFKTFSNYKTDADLANLLNVTAEDIAEYMNGATQLPFHTWQTFLIITGRRNQLLLQVEFYA